MNLSNWYRGGYRDWLKSKTATGPVAPNPDAGGLAAPKPGEGRLPTHLDVIALLDKQLAAIGAAVDERSASITRPATHPRPGARNETPPAANCG
jgi:hypothetical protein